MNTFLIQAENLLKKKTIGAILVEPVQGRGGEIMPPDWFLPLLRSLANQFGVLLIFDEIYTGFHRTGRRFACDHWNVQPDLVCLGKALTSGFPLGACVGRAKVMDDAWPESTGEALHTSTFLGNPLGCRMALESLDLLEAEPWSKRVEELGTRLEKGLRKIQSTSKRWGWDSWSRPDAWHGSSRSERKARSGFGGSARRSHACARNHSAQRRR